MRLKEIIESYDPDAPLARASTIPSTWYTDERVFRLEQETVFSHSWQVVARSDQFTRIGDFVTTEVAEEPVVLVRGRDNGLRGFFNVCRHHAAAVMTDAEGHAEQMRCPYHGWTYSLEGELRGTPDFNDVCSFDRSQNGLLPLEIATWEKWIFARLSSERTQPLESFLGRDLIDQINPIDLNDLHWFARRRYTLNCNWKVFIDNYLDGGYHVPHLHRSLDSVLDYSNYTIENGARYCLQSSPMVNPVADSFSGGETPADNEIGAVRRGRALYYWLYPNFMMNYYEGVLDTNLVRPITVDQTEVIFDFYFAEVSAAARERNLKSVDVGERIQQEDVEICESVQRGLRSRAYESGRLSARREAGEHLFHRLLHADLKTAIQ
ncbi:MAG: aromatic ring-hydroxylating dioxygenase subunit alpha [Pyrinomonadaceae bacterium]